MTCPKCAQPAGCKETRAGATFQHRWIKDFAADHPGITVRRRLCSEHGTFLTLEVTLEDLQALLTSEASCQTN